jgi:uncharacterized repeat protein (TIGR01451 family)
MGEWDSGDFFADMRRAGKTDGKIEAKLYLRYDCETSTLYALVRPAGDWPVVVECTGTDPTTLEDAWIEIDGMKYHPSPETPSFAEFAWINERTESGRDVADGWEASLSVATGSYTLDVHTNVLDDGEEQTAQVPDPISLVISCTDLNLTKDVDDSNPTVGDQVMFTITVTNEGSEDASGVEVVDFLSTNLSYHSDDGDAAYDPNIWTVGNLGVGASATLHITFTVEAEGGFENCAEIHAADQGDVDSTPNNRISTEDDIGCAVGSAGPTAVTLSSFAAESSAGGAVSPLWLGAGLMVLAAGSLFWIKRGASQ